MIRALQFLLNDVPEWFRTLPCRLFGHRPSPNSWIEGQRACSRCWQGLETQDDKGVVE